METGRTISLSDLLRYRRPLTGAAFLASANPPIPSTKRQMTSPPDTTTSNAPPLPSPNFRVSTLTPLTHPVVLIGTIDLPTLDSPCPCGSHNRCLSFSDDASRVCCDVLDLDVGVVGRKVKVLAWNFVPFMRGEGGVLEIIRLELWEGGGSCGPSLGSSSVVRGLVRAVSPVFAVPGGGEKKDGAGPLGFIVELGVCECVACGKRMLTKDRVFYENFDQHCFNECLFVYFYGSGFCWHPILCKMVGRVIEVSSLKKKKVFVGHEESYLMLVSTEKTVVWRSWCPMGISSVSRIAIPRSDEFGTYHGMVTGVYMKGMVVELDEKAWLLPTDPLLSMPHSVRVGAFVFVRNVHIVPSNLSWTKAILIGTCIKTTVDVKSFSPSDAQCSLGFSSQTLLGKFINSLTISAKLWVLLLISCFSRKFVGVLSDKDILGSKDKGVFMEFCKHDEYGCRNHKKYSLLDLVAPLSNLIDNCKEMWMSTLSSDVLGVSKQVAGLFCEGHSFDRLNRQIISSKDLGIVLMGTIRNSSSTGRVQLFDETGSIDIVIPDVPVDFDPDIIYQVKDYKLVIEGLPQQIEHFPSYPNNSLSCRSIFHYPQILTDLAGLTVYIHFYMRNLVCVKDLFGFSVARNKLLEGSTFFHLLVLKHKFPSRDFQDKQVNLNRSCGFAEATVLPYDLIITGEYGNGDGKPKEFYGTSMNEEFKYADWSALTEKWWSPKSYRFHVPDRTLLDCSSNSHVCGEMELSRIRCLLSSSGKIFRGILIPSNLFSTSITLCKSTGKQSAANILLEFKKDAFYSFQSLRVGEYYIMKENPCDKVHNKDYIKYGKATLTSRNSLWRFIFSLQKTEENSNSQWIRTSNDSSVGTYCSLFSDTQDNILCFNQLNGDSDIQLKIFSQDMELLSFVKDLQKDLSIISYPAINEVLCVTSCIETVTHLQLVGTTKSECQLSEGILISLCGDVMDVHFFQPNSFNRPYFDGTEMDFQHGVGIICIHVYENNHMVKVQGCFGKNIYPLGIGAGTNITFHRLLVTCNSGRWCKLSIIPASFLVVNSVKEVGPYQKYNWHNQSLALKEHLLCMIPLKPCFQSTKHYENNAIRIRCRVDQVLMLVLQKEHCKPKNDSQLQYGKLHVRIPIAGFVMDDGSTCCCCWADAERAEMILRLQESLFRYFVRRISKIKGFRCFWNSFDNHLDSILKKHHKVTIKNHGAMQDPNAKITFSVNSGKVFSSSDEKFLKSIIFYAGKGPVLDLVGIIMDLNAPGCLVKSFGLGVPEWLNIRNIWVTEVSLVNYLETTKNLLSELLAR